MNVGLGFLEKGRKYKAIVYKDGPGADWKQNPEAYAIETLTVDSKSQLVVKLAAGGGAGGEHHTVLISMIRGSNSSFGTIDLFLMRVL